MSLLHYEVDFSHLSIDEKNAAEESLDHVTYNGLLWRPDFKSAEFFVESNSSNVIFPDLPASCHLRQIP